MFETIRYNKRKIRDLILTLEAFEHIQDLRCEFMEYFAKSQEAMYVVCLFDVKFC